MHKISKTVTLSICLLLVLHVGTVDAAERIAVLSFELNDITSLPNTPAEQLRTATFKPLLEQAIQQKGGYQIMHINLEQQRAENAGFGYLFRFHDVAARLGKTIGADWLVVGQHSKPSFLFSYLMVNLIHVETGQLLARFNIELKGNHEKVTQRGVKKLSNKIDAVIVRQGRPAQYSEKYSLADSYLD